MFSDSRMNVAAPTGARPFGRAVVVGGSIAGLLAARVLAEHFATVTVVERTEIADGRSFPKGAPQARHPHVLLIRGEQILESFLPGIGQELLAAGASKLNLGRDVGIRFPAGWLPHYETDLEAISTSRRLLDHAVFQRVAAYPNITFREHSDVMALCADESNREVIGVQIRNRQNGVIEDIPAEFVVDASGRSSKAPEWLSQLGFQPPAEQTVNAFPGYSTRIYEIPEGVEHSWRTLYIMPNPPHISRGAIILPMEGNLWHVCLIGMNGDYPPADEAGFVEFAHSLTSPTVFEAITAARPISPIWGYRRAENRLRHFDQMPDFLDGFVALGDAVYALNPVYGQGMTLAAIANQLLDANLRRWTQRSQAHQFAGLAETYQKQLKKALALPWQTATNEDMRWSDTEGKQTLDLGSRLIGRYFGFVLQAMPHSTRITDAFFRVQHMIAPPTLLLRPDIMAAVLKTTMVEQFANP